jgi:hypothetical protein
LLSFFPTPVATLPIRHKPLGRDMISRTILAGLAAMLPTSAFAHGGHLGELAGHSHWVGVAALAGAALVAGIIALKDKKQKKAEDAPEARPEDDETAGEAAQ